MTTWRFQFPEPCTESWDGMTPEERGRHCGKCDRVVHDLATYTPEEARALIDRPPGTQACVRALVRRNGQVQTRPSPSGMVLALALGLPLAACDVTEQPVATAGVPLPIASVPDGNHYEANAKPAIAITVVDEASQPIVGALIILTGRKSRHPVQQTTDATGKTPVIPLRPGDYHLEISAAGKDLGCVKQVTIKPDAVLVMTQVLASSTK